MSDTLPLSIINNRRLEKWLRFQPDRTVKLAVGKVEIGQGVLIALSQIAAEELDVAIDRASKRRIKQIGFNTQEGKGGEGHIRQDLLAELCQMQAELETLQYGSQAASS